MREPLSTTFKKALTESQTAARELDQDFVGTEHLMLGLLSTDGEATHVLKAIHADSLEVKVALMKVLPRGEQPPVVTGDLPLSPKAQRIVNGAIVKAQALRETRVSTRFLLLSLLDDSDSTIFAALKMVGADIESLQPKLAEKPISIES